VGKLDAVRALLNLASPKPVLDVKDSTGSTPLLLAAAGGHRGTALFLTASGADVEVENAEGETPLGAAAAFAGLREAMVELATGSKTLDDFHVE
jgi:ankyrin repeat protein